MQTYKIGKFKTKTLNIHPRMKPNFITIQITKVTGISSTKTK